MADDYRSKMITPVQSLTSDAAMLAGIVGDAFKATVPAAPRQQSALEIARTVPGLGGAAMGSLMGPQEPPPAPPKRAAPLPQTPINAGGEADAFATLPPGEDNGLGFWNQMILSDKQQQYLIDQKARMDANKAKPTAPKGPTFVNDGTVGPTKRNMLALQGVTQPQARRNEYDALDFIRDSQGLTIDEINSMVQQRQAPAKPPGYQEVVGMTAYNSIAQQMNAILTDPNATEPQKLAAYNKAQESLLRLLGRNPDILASILAGTQAQPEE